MSNKPYPDPSYAELAAHLLPMVGRYDGIDYDMNEAIYWYAHDRCHGLWRRRDEVMLAALASGFRTPDAYSTGLPDNGPALDLYTELLEEFGG